MPRKAPTQVTEHRVTLGTWERDRIETVMMVGTLPVVAISGGVLLASYAFWRLVKFWAGITESAKDLAVGLLPVNPDTTKASFSIWKAFFKEYL